MLICCAGTDLQRPGATAKVLTQSEAFLLKLENVIETSLAMSSGSSRVSKAASK
jgi:hypothetical protein